MDSLTRWGLSKDDSSEWNISFYPYQVIFSSIFKNVFMFKCLKNRPQQVWYQAPGGHWIHAQKLLRISEAQFKSVIAMKGASHLL
jgi:hypothetical protein